MKNGKELCCARRLSLDHARLVDHAGFKLADVSVVIVCVDKGGVCVAAVAAADANHCADGNEHGARDRAGDDQRNLHLLKVKPGTVIGAFCAVFVSYQSS